MRNNVIVFPKNVTSFKFYNEILSELHLYFRSGDSRELSFDFSDVEFINPLVVPNILCVGLIIKSHLKRPIELFIPWKKPLISYLDDIGFLRNCNKYKLFNIDERFIGGYESGLLNEECNTYAFDPGTSKGEIRTTLRKSSTILETLYKDAGICSEERLDQVFSIFTEICHNGCEHSGQPCFATFQASSIRKIDLRKVYISISDCGVGFLPSIKKNISTGIITSPKFIDLEKGRADNLLSIFEAAFMRRDEKIYGLYSAIKDTISLNGIARIHSNDSQVVFTKNNFENYIEDYDCLLRFLERYDRDKSQGDNEKHFHFVRERDVSLNGVHVELEIPFS